jgi:excisionase family DNA binding protein
MTTSRETPALLTVEQAAERLGTSVRFVRRLRAERRLPFVKLGKHLRIDSADLEAFIDAHRERPWHQAS